MLPIAIVLSAGLGTRLSPITQVLPKPCVPINGKPLGYHQIEALLKFGFDTVHCNTHHLEMDMRTSIQNQLIRDGYPMSAVRFWHEPELLETGGAIARIAKQLHIESAIKQDIFVLSGDIFGTLNLQKFINAWNRRSSNTFATMATLPSNGPRKDATWVCDNQVVGFGADTLPSTLCESRVFSTFQILAARVVETLSVIKQSSIDMIYRAGLRQGLNIQNYEYDGHDWADIGTLDAYANCLHDQNEKRGQVHTLSSFDLPIPHFHIPLNFTPTAYSHLQLHTRPVNLDTIRNSLVTQTLETTQPLFIFSPPTFDHQKKDHSFFPLSETNRFCYFVTFD